MNKIIVARAIGSFENKTIETVFKKYKIDIIQTATVRIIENKKATLNLKNINAVLLTSFHGASFFSRKITDKNIKIFTVGKSTADTVRKKGFKNIIECDGDGASMLNVVENSLNIYEGKILYAGAAKISINIPRILEKKGYTMKRVILYTTTEEKIFDKSIKFYLQEGIIKWVVLLSQQGAEVFIRLLKKNIDEKIIKSISFACLSHSIAKFVNNSGYYAIHPKKPDINYLPDLIIKRRK